MESQSKLLWRGGGGGEGDPKEEEEMTEGKMATMASKLRPPPTPLAQGLDPPLTTQ